VARLGGDEFVVLVEGLSENQQEAATETRNVGEKILSALDPPYQLASVEHRCTASIGATLFCGQETSIDDLLRQADLAMYKAKEYGRNTLRFFDPAMQTAVMARANLEKSLRRAILEKQFILHYQPQVDGNGGRVVGAEALVRWLRPEHGMVPPSDFIQLAEETGLIVALGTWVLRTSCNQLADWASHSAMAHLSIAVNVSPKQFRENDFVETMLNVLDETGANAKLLKIELTEGLLVDNVQDIIEKMNALKARGVCFSLDDFGTGYSSLSYLSRLPLDQLKIDRSFVAQIEVDESSVAICAATVSLAHSLRLEVVAEGVETEAQRYFLSTVHKCDYLQGYLFSMPLPVEAFENFVLGA
jgi:predicted signal transduction protein with EAL and GGDEF domain